MNKRVSAGFLALVGGLLALVAFAFQQGQCVDYVHSAKQSFCQITYPYWYLAIFGATAVLLSVRLWLRAKK